MSDYKVCARCQSRFESIEEYRQHMLTRTEQSCRPIGITKKPKSIEQAKLQREMAKKVQPQIEVKTEVKEVKVAQKDVKPQVEKPLNTPKTALNKKVVSTPIKLTYRWEGQCPKCQTEVKTLILKTVIKDKWVTIAYCQHCDQQLRERPVESL